MAKLTQAVSAVSPLGDALREPVKKPRAPRKAKPGPVLDTKFVCHCGERFDDLREAWIHVRAEYGDLRQILNDIRASRRIAACGTSSGYNAHLRRGEPSCEACVQAKRAKDRAYIARPDKKAHIAAQKAAWYAANRDRELAKMRAYRQRPGVREARNARRRARRDGSDHRG